MTTKRKPEDVVLDVYAERLAWGCVDLVDRGTRENMGAALRTYIAELDLIPRPQTVEEWVAQMPGSVWEGNSYRQIRIYGTCEGYPSLLMQVISRPKPPRMTDEEIERLATETAKNTALGDSRATIEDRAFAIGIYRQTRDELLAERAKLEKERGDG